MKSVKVKMRSAHFERFSMPKNSLSLKMGVEQDELDQLISNPIKHDSKHSKKKSLDHMIRSQNKNSFLNDLYGI